MSFLFGVNTENGPNKAIFKKAQGLYNRYAHSIECCLIRQTAQGEVTLITYGNQEIKRSRKGCLSSKQVIDLAIELLNKAGISLKNSTWHVVSHEDHIWPAMILRKKGFSVKWHIGATKYADRSEPQRRCRRRVAFLLYRALVLTHHRLKGWI